MNPTPVSVEKEEIMRDANAVIEDLSHGAPSAPPASMVEKVARAMCGATGNDPDMMASGSGDSLGNMVIHSRLWELYVTQAHAAIAALREPTPEMMAAGFAYTGGPRSSNMQRACFNAMLDAALEPIGSQKRSDQTTVRASSRAAPLSFPETKPHEQPTGWPEKSE